MMRATYYGGTAGDIMRVASWLVLLVVTAGCERGGGGILVSAASDLAAVLPELTAEFTAQSGTPVTVTLGASGQLAQQIQQGAPVDVFLSADAGWVDRLEAAGRVEAGARAVYAYGHIVLLASAGGEAPASLDALRSPAYGRIALANPAHAPYGRAAHQALERSGLLPEVSARLVIAENVRQTVQFAEAGAVDVAFSALSLMDPNRHRWLVVPQHLYDPLAQTAAVVAGTARGDEARAFLAFLAGGEGRDILQRFGFALP